VLRSLSTTRPFFQRQNATDPPCRLARPLTTEQRAAGFVDNGELSVGPGLGIRGGRQVLCEYMRRASPIVGWVYVVSCTLAGTSPRCLGHAPIFAALCCRCNPPDGWNVSILHEGGAQPSGCMRKHGCGEHVTIDSPTPSQQTRPGHARPNQATIW
jgi:hypothetical protein